MHGWQNIEPVISSIEKSADFITNTKPPIRCSSTKTPAFAGVTSEEKLIQKQAGATINKKALQLSPQGFSIIKNRSISPKAFSEHSHTNQIACDRSTHPMINVKRQSEPCIFLLAESNLLV